MIFALESAEERQPCRKLLSLAVALCSPMPPVNTSLSRPPKSPPWHRSLCQLIANIRRARSGLLVCSRVHSSSFRKSLLTPDTPSSPDSLIEKLLQFLGDVKAIAQQVENDAGVQVTATRAHHDSTRRSQAHVVSTDWPCGSQLRCSRRRDALSPVDGGTGFKRIRIDSSDSP